MGTYSGEPIELKLQTRLGLMSATFMAGAGEYSAETAVLAAIHLDRTVSRAINERWAEQVLGEQE